MRRLIAYFNRYRFVLGELVKKGVKLKYRKSYLGIFWSLLEPLMTMIVLYFVFGALLGRGGEINYRGEGMYGGLHFALYILSGKLIFTYFAQTTKGCTRVMTGNASLIKKVHIPKYLFPLSGMLFNYILFAISLIVLFGVSGVLMLTGQQFPFNWYMLQAIIPLITLFLLTYGAGMLLATIGVYFKDMQYLWNVMCMLIMYSSAIFFSMDRIIENSPRIYMVMQLNPLYCVIANFRRALAGVPLDMRYMLYSLIFGLVSVVVGSIVLRKSEDNFILHI